MIKWAIICCTKQIRILLCCVRVETTENFHYNAMKFVEDFILRVVITRIIVTILYFYESSSRYIGSSCMWWQVPIQITWFSGRIPRQLSMTQNVRLPSIIEQSNDHQINCNLIHLIQNGTNQISLDILVLYRKILNEKLC